MNEKFMNLESGFAEVLLALSAIPESDGKELVVFHVYRAISAMQDWRDEYED